MAIQERNRVSNFNAISKVPKENREELRKMAHGPEASIIIHPADGALCIVYTPTKKDFSAALRA